MSDIISSSWRQERPEDTLPPKSSTGDIVLQLHSCPLHTQLLMGVRHRLNRLDPNKHRVSKVQETKRSHVSVCLGEFLKAATEAVCGGEHVLTAAPHLQRSCRHILTCREPAAGNLLVHVTCTVHCLLESRELFKPEGFSGRNAEHP